MFVIIDGDDDVDSVGRQDNNSGRDEDVFAEAEETQVVAQNNDADIISRTQISKKTDELAAAVAILPPAKEHEFL
jgi:hypothetical protein